MAAAAAAFGGALQTLPERVRAAAAGTPLPDDVPGDWITGDRWLDVLFLPPLAAVAIFVLHHVLVALWFKVRRRGGKGCAAVAAGMIPQHGGLRHAEGGPRSSARPRNGAAPAGGAAPAATLPRSRRRLRGSPRARARATDAPARPSPPPPARPAHRAAALWPPRAVQGHAGLC
jgi:hypothetical protein